MLLQCYEYYYFSLITYVSFWLVFSYFHHSIQGKIVQINCDTMNMNLTKCFLQFSNILPLNKYSWTVYMRQHTVHGTLTNLPWWWIWHQRPHAWSSEWCRRPHMPGGRQNHLMEDHPSVKTKWQFTQKLICTPADIFLFTGPFLRFTQVKNSTQWTPVVAKDSNIQTTDNKTCLNTGRVVI